MIVDSNGDVLAMCGVLWVREGLFGYGCACVCVCVSRLVLVLYCTYLYRNLIRFLVCNIALIYSFLIYSVVIRLFLKCWFGSNYI